MYTHELINLLKTFTNKELMMFGKFLNSPYFNSRKRIIHLFKVLKNYYPEFDAKGFTKENIFRSIYKNNPYNDSTFRNLMSDLLSLALQFVKQEGMEKKGVQSAFFLTTELFMRGTYNLFRNKMNNCEKILENNHTIDSEYFLNKYTILTDSFYVNLLTQKVIKKDYVVSESGKMVTGIVCLLSYFVLQSMKHYDNLLKYSRSYNIKKNVETVSQFMDIFDFDKLISYIRHNSTLKIPVVEIYYKLLKAFANFEDETFYTDLKKSVLVNSEKLGNDDNYFLFTRLIDYSVVKKNTGMHASYNIETEIFELNDIFVRNEFYKTEANKYLPFDFYRNVLLNCIALKRLDYMEEFIKNNSKKLLPKHSRGFEDYSYALLYFEKKNYTKALLCINRIKFDQFLYKLDMKNLQLKINYELEQYESAISVIDTYKHFLKNNVLISESRRILHNNFLDYTNKLIQYRIGSQKVNLLFIKDRIEKSKMIFDKVWLLDKANYLSGFDKKMSDNRNTRKFSTSGL